MSSPDAKLPTNSRRRLLAGLAVLAVAALCFGAFWPGRRAAFSGVDGPAISRSDLQTAIDRAAGYLVEATGEDGFFTYRVNPNPKAKSKSAYNILRHGGAIYAMSMYLDDQPSGALTAPMREAMLRAGRYLRSQAIGPLPEGEGLLAVWSKPEVNRRNKPLQAKLGGAGLGLVALAGLERIEPGFTPLADLRGLGRFIVFMQKPDGGFVSKYIPATGGRDDSWTSLYYPGEAALGLLMLHELDRAELWLSTAVKALAYLAREREGKTDVPADHWALLATAKLLSLERAEMTPDLRRRLVGHAEQICEAILADQVAGSGRGGLAGGFNALGRVTPTATRLEGLLAARTFLPNGSDLGERIDDAVARGIDFLLRAQITQGELAGGFPWSVGRLDSDDSDARRFNRRATEVRIDYVQHALSALIQYRDALPPGS